ncbi:hypothetical protein B0H63DRAFT_556836 [Podospora didyma]|uniref:DUF7580 domain-containing protein n=1 Tax=Podospora didyma TaxID=330526 RepID=A0AAE0NY29_9PEZI|nr:hypothetical protein B0H63DRAFT_556836 [Podospora didyma]
MSGFEVAGVVLAALPLIISSLEHYRSGKGAASAFVKWHGHLDKLIFRLKLQQTFFYLDTLELLRVANVEEIEDRVDLTEEECAAVLADAKTGEELKRFLGPLYATSIEILGRYEACLKALAGKIGHIKRLPKTAKDDLREILRANPPNQGKFAFKERLSFTMERGALKVLLEELQEERLSLKVITKSMITQQEYATREPSQESLKMVQRFAKVRDIAVSLFSALCRGSSNCQCRTQHSAMAQLESRVFKKQQERRKLDQGRREPTLFNIVLPLDGTVLQQALVNAVMDEEDASNPVCTMLPSPPTSGSRTVTFSPAIHTAPQRPSRSEVNNLCLSGREAWNKGDLLRLELVADILALSTEIGASQPPTSSINKISTDTTLEAFLSYGWQNEEARLTPKQQTLFALDIASSILQFHETRWFIAPWNSKTIKFLVANTNTTTTQGGISVVIGAFIEQNLHIPALQQQQPSPSNQSPKPETALLELAILLLEIWHHRPLDVWASAAQIDVHTPDHRRIAATRWLQSTAERLPLHYLIAVEQCLAICSGRLRYWSDDTFQKYYCENIIKPLLESCKTWVG